MSDVTETTDTNTYTKVVDGQRYIFSEYELEEHFVDRQIDDARVQHCLCYELADDSEDMRPFSICDVSCLPNRWYVSYSLLSVVRQVIWCKRSGEETGRMVDVWTRLRLISIAPDLQITARKLF